MCRVLPDVRGDRPGVRLSAPRRTRRRRRGRHDRARAPARATRPGLGARARCRAGGAGLRSAAVAARSRRPGPPRRARRAVARGRRGVGPVHAPTSCAPRRRPTSSRRVGDVELDAAVFPGTWRRSTLPDGDGAASSRWPPATPRARARRGRWPRRRARRSCSRRTRSRPERIAAAFEAEGREVLARAGGPGRGRPHAGMARGDDAGRAWSSVGGWPRSARCRISRRSSCWTTPTKRSRRSGARRGTPATSRGSAPRRLGVRCRSSSSPRADRSKGSCAPTPSSRPAAVPSDRAGHASRWWISATRVRATGMLSEALGHALRRASTETARALCVLNRKGRARLLVVHVVS